MQLLNGAKKMPACATCITTWITNVLFNSFIFVPSWRRYVISHIFFTPSSVKMPHPKLFWQLHLCDSTISAPTTTVKMSQPANKQMPGLLFFFFKRARNGQSRYYDRSSSLPLMRRLLTWAHPPLTSARAGIKPTQTVSKSRRPRLTNNGGGD